MEAQGVLDERVANSWIKRRTPKLTVQRAVPC